MPLETIIIDIAPKAITIVGGGVAVGPQTTNLQYSGNKVLGIYHYGAFMVDTDTGVASFHATVGKFGNTNFSPLFEMRGDCWQTPTWFVVRGNRLIHNKHNSCIAARSWIENGFGGEPILPLAGQVHILDIVGGSFVWGGQAYIETSSFEAAIISGGVLYVHDTSAATEYGSAVESWARVEWPNGNFDHDNNLPVTGFFARPTDDAPQDNIQGYSYILTETNVSLFTLTRADPEGGYPGVVPIRVAISPTIVGGIVKVEYYANNQLVGFNTAPPYSFNWARPSAGSYQLRAKLITNTQTYMSEPVNIDVITHSSANQLIVITELTGVESLTLPISSLSSSEAFGTTTVA